MIKKSPCYLCQKEINNVDHTNTSLLAGFLTAQGEIKKHRRGGLCSQHQRKVTRAIKRARTLGLLPYVAGHDS